MPTKAIKASKQGERSTFPSFVKRSIERGSLGYLKEQGRPDIRQIRMAIVRNTPDAGKFNSAAVLPYELRIEDFKIAMQDVYDFFYDVNKHLVSKGLQRLDDTLRPAIMSGFLSDMLTGSVAKHSRTLTQNEHHNGHPDLIVRGVYPNNAVKAGEQGVEIKTTRKAGGAVDMHGARNQWMCVFVYEIDDETEPATARRAMSFTEIYLAQVTTSDFRRNERGELGTRTATLERITFPCSMLSRF